MTSASSWSRVPGWGEGRFGVEETFAVAIGVNYPQEIQPVNFMPRVKVPVVLVDCKDDFSAPEPAQRRFIDLIGTLPENKRHRMLDGGHIPNDWFGLIREVLDWLDKYQPVPGGS
jgi:hypothetical protein